MNNPVINQVIQQLQTLPTELQWRVLEFARALVLSMPQSRPGRELLDFAGTISLEDIHLMEAAIKQGCEQVDANEW